MRLFKFVIASLLIFIFNTSSAFAQKTLIFYSSIGMGHLSASRAIEEKIKQQDPTAEVELKNIRDFMPSFSRVIDEKLYFIVFKYFPKFFNKAYLDSMEKGLKAVDLSDLKSGYNEAQLLDYIRTSHADTVIATHYGAAIHLGNLKTSGQLSGIKTAWVHTDYIEHYFPRISSRLGKTFLGHSKLAEAWMRFGVSEEKVAVTGIPVRNLPEAGKNNRAEIFEAVGLSSEPVTFVMSGGSEGLKNYTAAIQSLAAAFKDPIQIVAVCGKNQKALAELEILQRALPSHVTLKPMGFIPNKQLIDLISVSDLYVTKAGGLSPTEGALLMKPLVLINEYGGHEAENADFFKRTQMAEIVQQSKDLGAKAVEVLGNPEMIQTMMENQREYRNSINLESIATWSASEGVKDSAQFELGLKKGAAAVSAVNAINKLQKDFPGDVEILLSYAKSKTGTYFGDGKESNPFGHIAIRVGDLVYTVNHMAQRDSEPHLLHKSTLEEYLYSTKEYYKNEEFTGMQGQAYAKDTIALRIDGISKEKISEMLTELTKIDQEWIHGKLNYTAKYCNCADITLKVLKAAGIITQAKIDSYKVKLPIDVFDAAMSAVQADTTLQTSLIQYGYVKSSKNEYKTAGFPLSFYQLKRAVRNMFSRGKDKIESQVHARLNVDKNSSEVRYENVGQTELKKAIVPIRCEFVF